MLRRRRQVGSDRQVGNATPIVLDQRRGISRALEQPDDIIDDGRSVMRPRDGRSVRRRRSVLRRRRQVGSDRQVGNATPIVLDQRRGISRALEQPDDIIDDGRSVMRPRDGRSVRRRRSVLRRRRRVLRRWRCAASANSFVVAFVFQSTRTCE